MIFFKYFTPLTYWLLVLMWSFILIFYVRRLRKSKIKSELLFILFIILSIDAFRTLFESVYFGAWYTSLVGFLPKDVYEFLVRPEIVFIPKALNVIAAVVVIVILLYRWIPQEEQEKEFLENLVEKRTQDLAKANETLTQEIIERRHVEKALKKSETLLSESQKLAKVGGWEWNIKTQQIFWTDEVYHIHGLDPQKIRPGSTSHIDQSLLCYSPADRPVIKNAFDRCVKEGIAYDLTVAFTPVTGHKKWIRTTAHAVKKNGKVAKIIGNIIDITEQKMMEFHLGHVQKFESIGTLAGGIAHEINNPINGIMNYAQLILDKTDKKNSQAEYASEIIHETRRVTTIVRNLLTFARNEKETHNPAQLKEIIDDTLSLIKTVLKKDQISLEIDLPDELPEINCHSQQLQQVIMNLITNARDTLNERYPEYDENKKIMISSAVFRKNGTNWIRLTVEDHGKGIGSNIQDKIFDPFFTTKDRASGTGFGLSISYGILKDHQGELYFESELGQYTRFHMSLPAGNTPGIKI